MAPGPPIIRHWPAIMSIIICIISGFIISIMPAISGGLPGPGRIASGGPRRHGSRGPRGVRRRGSLGRPAGMMGVLGRRGGLRGSDAGCADEKGGK